MKFDGVFGLSCGNFQSKDVGERIFSRKNVIQNQTNIEAALARAEAKFGVIPQWAADEITGKCDASLLDEECRLFQTKEAAMASLPKKTTPRSQWS